MAVAGSAVGLGNFLRFPGLAAQYGSGAFMIAYFISLLILGIPICWAEWTLGRYAGQRGFHSSPGIFYALIKHPVGPVRRKRRSGLPARRPAGPAGRAVPRRTSRNSPLTRPASAAKSRVPEG